MKAPLLIALIILAGCEWETHYDDAMHFLEANGYSVIMADPKPPTRRPADGDSFWFRAEKDGKTVEGNIDEMQTRDGKLTWLIRIRGTR